MEAKVRIGNSHGVRIPKVALQQTRLSAVVSPDEMNQALGT
jgi:antitoxin component of MazEF toxin-antitoxin module